MKNYIPNNKSYEKYFNYLNHHDLRTTKGDTEKGPPSASSIHSNVKQNVCHSLHRHFCSASSADRTNGNESTKSIASPLNLEQPIKRPCCYHRKSDVNSVENVNLKTTCCQNKHDLRKCHKLEHKHKRCEDSSSLNCQLSKLQSRSHLYGSNKNICDCLQYDLEGNSLQLSKFSDIFQSVSKISNAKVCNSISSNSCNKLPAKYIIIKLSTSDLVKNKGDNCLLDSRLKQQLNKKIGLAVDHFLKTNDIAVNNAEVSKSLSNEKENCKNSAQPKKITQAPVKEVKAFVIDADEETCKEIGTLPSLISHEIENNYSTHNDVYKETEITEQCLEIADEENLENIDTNDQQKAELIKFGDVEKIIRNSIFRSVKFDNDNTPVPLPHVVLHDEKNAELIKLDSIHKEVKNSLFKSVKFNDGRSDAVINSTFGQDDECKSSDQAEKCSNDDEPSKYRQKSQIKNSVKLKSKSKTDDEKTNDKKKKKKKDYHCSLRFEVNVK